MVERCRMREFNKESASKRDILEWTEGIIDARIEEEKALAQQYHETGDKGQALYFKNRLTWDYAAKKLIAWSLNELDDDIEGEAMPFISEPLESLEE